MTNSADPACFAVMAKDEIRKISSSGGVFTLAAEWIIDRGGLVAGAMYEEDFSVRLGFVSKKEDLGKMRGSKYIQAKLGMIYRETKKYLEQGRMVLFTGLPCHIAALYGILGEKQYPNLYTIDLVCHGMTSQKVFDKYRRDILKNRRLTDLRFKAKEPWGWHAGINAAFEDGTTYQEPLEKDEYFRAYLKNISKNTACSVCHLNQFPRQADLSIGDFWGINKYNASFNDGLGTSEVFVNNPHGQELLDAIRPETKLCERVPVEVAVEGNPVLKEPYKSNKNRQYFFDHLAVTPFGNLLSLCESEKELYGPKTGQESPQLKAALEAMNRNPDFIKIRILATLLRDYGVKDIVLSPGGRDVPLVRMFEYNNNVFHLHSVTDERSAAYFAMGLAVQSRRPVACVCTSGTAASNFLPAVTEAFFTGIPLIAITADRYAIYHGQGEDQTVEQSTIYRGAAKKEVTLTENAGELDSIQTIRDISDCILEATHGVAGPVHINVPVFDIAVGAKVPRQYWSLLPRISPHILRVASYQGHAEVMRWVDSLKKSQRILLVYGQNYPLSAGEREKVELFASKFNCVIVTDHISNLKCAYSLDSYNMLRKMSQKEFDEKLSPDILITVGGKRLMNDPLTFKIRHGKKNVRHWSVRPDGKIVDFYFRLTSVLEMSQDYFFDFFERNAGDIRNNGVYYNEWRQIHEQFHSPDINVFNAHYVQSRLLPRIPAGSLLHLGVGQAFIDSRMFPIQDNVTVYCNMGTNGIDGSTSTFMGQCAAVGVDALCFLLVGDLSFFYDMNAIWNKNLGSNVRILMVNNAGSGLLRGNGLKYITAEHMTRARGWVEENGFEYLSANNFRDFDEKLEYFLSDKVTRPLFFEVFCDKAASLQQ